MTKRDRKDIRRQAQQIDQAAQRINQAKFDDTMTVLSGLSGTMPLWYLSFVDPDILDTIPEEEQQPGGKSWLGGCFAPGVDNMAAVAASHRMGCNPGGQVAIVGPIPRDGVRPDYVGVLLTTLDELERAAVNEDPIEVRTCRACGCTDLLACPGGCSWVAANLCSQCAEVPPL